MSDEPIARKAMRLAERGADDDVSRLVASAPGLVREARRRRLASGTRHAATFDQVALAALPRLAAVTALAVIVAATFVWWEGRTDPSTAGFESLVLGTDGDGTGDGAFDALLTLEDDDG